MLSSATVKVLRVGPQASAICSMLLPAFSGMQSTASASARVMRNGGIGGFGGMPVRAIPVVNSLMKSASVPGGRPRDTRFDERPVRRWIRGSQLRWTAHQPAALVGISACVARSMTQVTAHIATRLPPRRMYRPRSTAVPPPAAFLSWAIAGRQRDRKTARHGNQGKLIQFSHMQ